MPPRTTTGNNSKKTTATMGAYQYPMPKGVHAIPHDELDLRPDHQIDAELCTHRPVPDGHEKNIWFFWHSGYGTMHPYTKRTVRTYHRRFSRKGWIIRVVDVAPDSPNNISQFVDTTDEAMFPKAFRDGTITGTYAKQHTSDLVRWPLLLRYGGIYADVGLMAIGDVDLLWSRTVGDRNSPYEVVSYCMDDVVGGDAYNLTNYFLGCGRGNALFLRCHRLLLALWAEDGGRTSTEGMHRSPLLSGLSLLGRGDHSSETQVALSDYIIQGQATRMAMLCVDDADGWDGPAYVRQRVYAIEYMVGSQLVNEMTAWDGPRAFGLLSLRLLPEEEESSSRDQQLARDIVEACLARSFGFKLAHGLIRAVLGETLGTLWRRHEGSDDVPGTYAHWLRHGMLYWCQDVLPEPFGFKPVTPCKRGALLRPA